MRNFLLYGLSGLALTAALSPIAAAQTASGELDTLDEIIVTGSPLTRSVDEAITGVSVLTGTELSNRLAGTIGETLKSEPGVSSTFFGAGASRPIIRGQGGDRVRVLTNGIGSIDASSASPDHAVAAEPAQAERIEVLRGASLLRYGSSGSGGIINVIDGRIPTSVPEKGYEGALRFGASSVDEGYEAAGSVDMAVGSFAGGELVLHLDGTYKKTQDYDIPGFAESAALRALEAAEEEEHDDDDHDEDHDDEEEAFGTLENSATETKAITGGLSYVSSRGYVGFAVHNFQSDYGIPGGHEHGHEGEEEHEGEDHEDEEGEEEENVTIGLDQTRMDINAALLLDGPIERLQFFGGIADYKHTEFEAPGEVGTVFRNDGYEARLEAIQRERNGWTGAHGVQYRKRDFSAIGEEAFVPPTRTEQIGLYTFHEKEMGNLHLEGAARYENTKQENANAQTSRSFDLLSLSAGGDIHVSNAVRFGGTVFRTERAPTTEELFSDGPHLATGQFERGDSTLGKEVATGIEAAFRHREAGHFLTLNLFYTDYNDYIFEAETAEIEDELPVFVFTADDASFKGFEIQGGMDVAEIGTFGIKLDALAEYVRAKTESGNLPRIPPLSLLGGIEAANDTLSLRAELDYAAAQKKTAVFETQTADSLQTNLFANWTLPLGTNKTVLGVSALNLFDVDARQHTSFLKDEVPLPGRNFRVNIRTEF